MKYTLKENITGSTSSFTTNLTITRNNNIIEFNFECHNSLMFNAGSNLNDSLYNGDVVEIFITNDKTLHTYYEFEVSPNNSHFNSLIKNDLKGHFENILLDDLFISNVIIDDNNYSVKMIIDLEKLNINCNDTILFNAFRIETEGGIINKNLLSLSPTLSNTFHDPKSFIILERNE